MQYLNGTPMSLCWSAFFLLYTATWTRQAYILADNTTRRLCRWAAADCTSQDNDAIKELWHCQQSAQHAFHLNASLVIHTQGRETLNALPCRSVSL